MLLYDITLKTLLTLHIS